MRAIISNNITTAYEKYRVFRSFEEVLEFKGNIDFVILHNSAETDLNAGLTLSKLNSNGIKTVAYINSKPSQILRMCVLAVGGVYEDDEFYFDDEGDLDFMVDEIENREKSIAVCDTLSTNMEVITDFIQSYIRKDAKITTEYYLKAVQNAVMEVSEQTKLANNTVKDVSMSAIDIFGQVSAILDDMQKSKEELEKKWTEAETVLIKQNKEHISPIKGMQQVFLFPTYNYLGLSKVLHICEVSPCKFLTSFLLAYHEYLKINQNKRVKLIIIHQKNKRAIAKYSDFVKITPEALANQDLVKSERVETDTPKEDVMKILTRQNDEVIIILDRMYNDPIIRGSVTTLYAVSGASDIRKHSLKAEKTIFSELAYPKCFLTIPKINNYSYSGENSASQYYQVCKETFKKLDDLLGLGED